MYQVVNGGLLDEVTRRVQLDICYDTTAKKECKLLVESKEQNRWSGRCVFSCGLFTSGLPTERLIVLHIGELVCGA